MWFWWFMFVCDIEIPIFMIAAGYMMWKHPSKKINGAFGYRTARSMKNIETWNFANNHCGRLWWKLGWIMLIPSVVIQFPFYHSSQNTIGILGEIVCAIQCVALVVSIFPTERALKKNFS